MTDREQFDEAFRRWAGRPPATSGAKAAAALFRPPRTQRATMWLSPAWATLASAAIVIASATAWVVRAPAPSPPLATVASRLPAPSADSDVVVLWLDDQTPVHVFLSEASARGGK